MCFRVLVLHKGSVEFSRNAHVQVSPHVAALKPYWISFPTTAPHQDKGAVAVKCFRPVYECFMHLRLKTSEHGDRSRSREK